MENMALRSSLYDDIYFSPDDGLAESEYVYIRGNHLQRRFRSLQRSPFVVGELGFGAGLNFLLTVQHFQAEAPEDALLHYFSVEKHPLPVAQIDQALSPLVDAPLRKRLVSLLRSSSWTMPGFHTLFFDERIRLTLLTGDAEEMLASLSGGSVDAWFADGFSPAKNPAMWTDGVFYHVGRLSRPGTTISTFSAAGAVRRSMQKHGFHIKKVPGFGSKREMVVGRYTAVGQDSVRSDPGHAVIIGGGLAGLCASLALVRRGWTVELRERLPATGQASSGNPAGLFMPYLTAQPTTISRFTLQACETLISALPAFGMGQLLHRTGIMRRTDQDLKKRIEKAIEAHGLPSSFIRPVDPSHYYIRKAGWTEPAALCRAVTERLVNGKRFTLKTETECSRLPEADAVVVAAGTGLAAFQETSFIPVRSVRGQLFLCEEQQAHGYLKGPIPRMPHVFENYIIPDEKGWVFGATFEPFSDRADRDPASDERLLMMVAEQFPEIGVPMQQDGFAPSKGRVGFRAQSKDYVPIIGPVPDAERSIAVLQSDLLAPLPVHDHVFVHGGFGSRGIMSSMLAAEVLVSHINGELQPVPAKLAEELLPHRFLRRQVRKGR